MGTKAIQQMRNRSRLHLSGKRRWVYLGATIGLVAFMLVVFLVDRAQSMISDQEMVDHFNAHKQDFNALVQTYLTYGRQPVEWANRPDVIELKTKTSIERIIDGPGYWFDDPYSLEAAKKLKQMDDEKSWAQNHSRKTAIVKMLDHRIHETFYWSVGGLNWKDYFYFPADPYIEHGRIKLPREPDGYKSIPHGLLWRVVDSTDSLHAWNSEMGECVMKKIEPKWYIRRCRSR